MGKKFSKDYEIHYYEVDCNLNCTIKSLINFIEDIGTTQSEGLGVGIDYLNERKMAWVFYQYDINIKRYPRHGETIKIVTEPYGFKRFYALRSYDMYDESGEKIVEAKAVFFLIDIEKRRAMRVPADQYEVYGVDGDIKGNVNIERLEKLEEAMYSKSFGVRFSDIDSNNHVNNTKYVEWAMESLPVEIIKDYELERIVVTFEKECHYGQEIQSKSAVLELEGYKIKSIHKIENTDGTELTKIIGYWKK
ncbi:acyl-[acyl-carrier-protein] thioesterase [Clostridium sp.]|uniref:acyl-[acyl-carrier-protein] thioesterase n=1 Tax=Clostridium sp. TaxID=1506 RepID=UPI003F35E6F9